MNVLSYSAHTYTNSREQNLRYVLIIINKNNNKTNGSISNQDSRLYDYADFFVLIRNHDIGNRFFRSMYQ